MDLHESLAFSTATAAQQEPMREVSDRDRESLHRLFNDMRRALVGTAHLHVAALPHP